MDIDKVIRIPPCIVISSDDGNRIVNLDHMETYFRAKDSLTIQLTMSGGKISEYNFNTLKAAETIEENIHAALGFRIKEDV